MSEESKVVRAFHWTSQAYYWPCGGEPDISFGLFNSDDKMVGQSVRMIWRDLGGKVYPQLCAFNDTWHLLPQFADVWEALAAGEDITEAGFADILREHGFQDFTQRERPGEKAALHRRLGELEREADKIRAQLAE